jgi:hypothetical protein
MDRSLFAFQISGSLPNNSTLKYVLFLAGAQPASYAVRRWMVRMEEALTESGYTHIKNRLQRSALSRNCAIVDVIACPSLGHQPQFVITRVGSSLSCSQSQLTHFAPRSSRHLCIPAHSPAKMRKTGPAPTAIFNCRNVRRPTVDCLSV